MDADYPGAIVVEARNFGYEWIYVDYLTRPRAWCLHTPEEVADSDPQTPYYFHNTTRDASTTYFVSYLGFVFQCVPESEGAYANAVEGKPYPVWADSKVNLNLQTLSVEIEGMAATIHQTMPRGGPQWNALVNLMAHRCKARNIPPGRTFPHRDVSIYRSDPGQLNIPLLVTDVIDRMEEEMAWTAAETARVKTLEDALAQIRNAQNILIAQAADIRGDLDGHAADVAKHAGGGVNEEQVKDIVRELVAD